MKKKIQGRAGNSEENTIQVLKLASGSKPVPDSAYGFAASLTHKEEEQLAAVEAMEEVEIGSNRSDGKEKVLAKEENRRRWGIGAIAPLFYGSGFTCILLLGLAIILGILINNVALLSDFINQRVVSTEKSSVIETTTLLANTTTSIFERFAADAVVVKYYAAKLFLDPAAGDIQTDKGYPALYPVIAVDPSTPPGGLDAQGQNTQYSLWWNLKNTDPNSEPLLGITTSLDNPFRVIFGETNTTVTPVRERPYTAVYFANSNGLLYNFPYSRQDGLVTLSYVCATNQSAAYGYDPRCRGWYHAVTGTVQSEEEPVVFGEPYIDAFGAGLLITASTSLRLTIGQEEYGTNYVNGSEVGVLGLDISLASLQQTLLAGTNNERIILLSDRSGKLIVFPSDPSSPVRASYTGNAVLDMKEALFPTAATPSIRRINDTTTSVVLDTCAAPEPGEFQRKVVLPLNHLERASTYEGVNEDGVLQVDFNWNCSAWTATCVPVPLKSQLLDASATTSIKYKYVLCALLSQANLESAGYDARQTIEVLKREQSFLFVLGGIVAIAIAVCGSFGVAKILAARLTAAKDVVSTIDRVQLLRQRGETLTIALMDTYRRLPSGYKNEVATRRANLEAGDSIEGKDEAKDKKKHIVKSANTNAPHSKAPIKEIQDVRNSLTRLMKGVQLGNESLHAMHLVTAVRCYEDLLAFFGSDQEKEKIIGASQHRESEILASRIASANWWPLVNNLATAYTFYFSYRAKSGIESTKGKTQTSNPRPTNGAAPEDSELEEDTVAGTSSSGHDDNFLQAERWFDHLFGGLPMEKTKEYQEWMKQGREDYLACFPSAHDLSILEDVSSPQARAASSAQGKEQLLVFRLENAIKKEVAQLKQIIRENVSREEHLRAKSPTQRKGGRRGLSSSVSFAFSQSEAEEIVWKHRWLNRGLLYLTWGQELRQRDSLQREQADDRCSTARSTTTPQNRGQHRRGSVKLPQQDSVHQRTTTPSSRASQGGLLKRTPTEFDQYVLYIVCCAAKTPLKGVSLQQQRSSCSSPKQEEDGNEDSPPLEPEFIRNLELHQQQELAEARRLLLLMKLERTKFYWSLIDSSATTKRSASRSSSAAQSARGPTSSTWLSSKFSITSTTTTTTTAGGGKEDSIVDFGSKVFSSTWNNVTAATPRSDVVSQQDEESEISPVEILRQCRESCEFLNLISARFQPSMAAMSGTASNASFEPDDPKLDQLQRATTSMGYQHIVFAQAEHRWRIARRCYEAANLLMEERGQILDAAKRKEARDQVHLMTDTAMQEYKNAHELLLLLISPPSSEKAKSGSLREATEQYHQLLVEKHFSFVDKTLLQYSQRVLLSIARETKQRQLQTFLESEVVSSGVDARRWYFLVDNSGSMRRAKPLLTSVLKRLESMKERQTTNTNSTNSEKATTEVDHEDYALPVWKTNFTIPTEEQPVEEEVKGAGHEQSSERGTSPLTVDVSPPMIPIPDLPARSLVSVPQMSLRYFHDPDASDDEDEDEEENDENHHTEESSGAPPQRKMTFMEKLNELQMSGVSSVLSSILKQLEAIHDEIEALHKLSEEEELLDTVMSRSMSETMTSPINILGAKSRKHRRKKAALKKNNAALLQRWLVVFTDGADNEVLTPEENAKLRGGRQLYELLKAIRVNLILVHLTSEGYERHRASAAHQSTQPSQSTANPSTGGTSSQTSFQLGAGSSFRAKKKAAANVNLVPSSSLAPKILETLPRMVAPRRVGKLLRFTLNKEFAAFGDSAATAPNTTVGARSKEMESIKKRNSKSQEELQKLVEERTTVLVRQILAVVQSAGKEVTSASLMHVERI